MDLQAEQAWSLVQGCTPVSTGCENCKARLILQQLGKSFDVNVSWEAINMPYTLKEPTAIFLCPLGDLFHKEVPYTLVSRALDVITKTPRHTYHILTKRAERMVEFFEDRYIPKNVWLGVSAENSQVGKERVMLLKQLRSKAQHLFVAAEPLLGSLRDVDITGIDWVIAAAEKGPNARALDWEVFHELQAQCEAAGVNFLDAVNRSNIHWGIEVNEK